MSRFISSDQTNAQSGETLSGPLEFGLSQVGMVRTSGMWRRRASWGNSIFPGSTVEKRNAAGLI